MYCTVQDVVTLLPENVKLISGPGCPVCVTANHYLDKAIAMANDAQVLTAIIEDVGHIAGTAEEAASKLGIKYTCGRR